MESDYVFPFTRLPSSHEDLHKRICHVVYDRLVLTDNTHLLRYSLSLRLVNGIVVCLLDLLQSHFFIRFLVIFLSQCSLFHGVTNTISKDKTTRQYGDSLFLNLKGV